jgi:alpha-tubulin suppressor-like RCC1 family protein
VYSFGYSGYGCLGIGSIDSKISPQKIIFENNDKITKIFTGCCCYGAFFYSSFYFFNFSLINFYFLEKKNLYSCGLNDCFQKGIFNGESKLKIPTIIDFFKNIEIENIFTGNMGTFIKTKS